MPRINHDAQQVIKERSFPSLGLAFRQPLNFALEANMEEVANRLVALIKAELPTGIEQAVQSFLAAYWELPDQQVNWSDPIGSALNDLAERLEYFEPTESPPFPGAITLNEAEILMNNFLTLAKNGSL